MVESLHCSPETPQYKKKSIKKIAGNVTNALKTHCPPNATCRDFSRARTQVGEQR